MNNAGVVTPLIPDYPCMHVHTNACTYTYWKMYTDTEMHAYIHIFTLTFRSRGTRAMTCSSHESSIGATCSVSMPLWM